MIGPKGWGHIQIKSVDSLLWERLGTLHKVMPGLVAGMIAYCKALHRHMTADAVREKDCLQCQGISLYCFGKLYIKIPFTMHQC